MAFCSFSSEYVLDGKISIDTSFITEFLPQCPEICTKAYLYGIYLCNTNKDISVEEVAKIFNKDVEDIISAYFYLQDLGLVIVNEEPFSVKFLPTKYSSYAHKTYDSKKYKMFNANIEELLDRPKSTNEYNEYYYLMENKGLAPEALIEIIKYCVKVKNNKINYPYIITVARDFIGDGRLTKQEVLDRIEEQESNTSETTEILKAMKINRTANIDDKSVYLYLCELGFNQDALITIAKHVKKGGMDTLKTLAEKCYNSRVYSSKEINEYFDSEKINFEIAKNICKTLGVRYEDLSNVVDTYIIKWQNAGYDESTLLKIANYCFHNSIRTLEAMDQIIDKFVSIGAINLDSIYEYLEEEKQTENRIKEILKTLNLSRSVIADDRAKYKLWTNTWGINDELIDFAAQKSAEMINSMNYLNRLLSTYKSQNITTIDEAKKVTLQVSGTKKLKSSRNYTEEEINSLFSDIKKVEL